MSSYAGIGSRKLSRPQWDFCYACGKWLAEQGWTLRTGACSGADQAFAEGALDAGGKIILCLPWPSYEFKWVNLARARGATSELLQYWHKDHFASVDIHHPAPERLSDAARSLHARNSLILDPCVRFVLAFPGPRLGGTGQGIRIANSRGTEVIRLDLPLERTRVENVIGLKL